MCTGRENLQKVAKISQKNHKVAKFIPYFFKAILPHEKMIKFLLLDVFYATIFALASLRSGSMLFQKIVRTRGGGGVVFASLVPFIPIELGKRQAAPMAAMVALQFATLECSGSNPRSGNIF